MMALSDQNVENDALPSEPDGTSSLALSSTGSGAVFHAEHGAGSGHLSSPGQGPPATGWHEGMWSSSRTSRTDNCGGELSCN
jgi:hypothetical protein